MKVMEIVLLVAGGIVFALSFLLPDKAKDEDGTWKKENAELTQKEIHSLVEKEMAGIKGQVEDVVEEAVGYAMEKTERSLERLSNEKIMAVSEYSDTVMQEISKNHEEVMFLYDMLNAKHTNLKETVSEVNKTVKVVEETAKEAEAVVSTIQKLGAETIKSHSITEETLKETETPDGQISAMDISFIQEADEEREGRNSNSRILELYKAGKSKVAIAKELGLGVGEVKLVIDLHKKI